jgi:hypothetical protein
MKLLDLVRIGLHAIWMGAGPKQRRRMMRRKRRQVPVKPLGLFALAHEQLEPRALLSITANNCSFDASSAVATQVAAPGLLAYCSDSGGYQMSAHEMSSPSDGTLTVNGDGSFTYTANYGFIGNDSFTYYATDTNGGRSGIAEVRLSVELGVSSSSNSTKVAVDTIDVSRQILSDPFWPIDHQPLAGRRQRRHGHFARTGRRGPGHGSQSIAGV